MQCSAAKQRAIGVMWLKAIRRGGIGKGAVYSGQYALCTEQCTVFSVQYTMYSEQCTVCSVHLQCSVCSVEASASGQLSLHFA